MFLKASCLQGKSGQDIFLTVMSSSADHWLPPQAALSLGGLAARRQ